VGLTDPILITLRKELVNAVSNKKWDEAQKIQAIYAIKKVEKLNL
jgi:hypothetical protein